MNTVMRGLTPPILAINIVVVAVGLIVGIPLGISALVATIGLPWTLLALTWGAIWVWLTVLAIREARKPGF